MSFRTLRWRLALWYGFSLALLLSLFGTVLYGLVRYQLIRHHDRALTSAAASVAGVLSERDDWGSLDDGQQAELDRMGHLVLVHEVEGGRKVFYRSPEAMAQDIPLAELPDEVSRPRFETLGGQHELLRMYSTPYRSRSGRQGVIRIVHSLGDVPAPLASLRLALLLMTPLSVLLATVGGYWLAARALGPVDDVTRLAREIGASNLGRRLPSPKAQDEIGRLVETFNAMISRLESSFAAMQRFTADASHELRGPLASMRGAVDVALSRAREPEEYRNVLRSVGEDVDRLRSIAEDLLMLARADAGRIEIERIPVRLDIVAAEVVESFRGQALEKGVSLISQSSRVVTILGDERWLRQLVYNLVDNAIKFSAVSENSAGATSVVVEVSEHESYAIMNVLDSGPGIPEAALPHVFERFFRADNARVFQQRDGFGLGLSIAAWIVEAHEGTITATNAARGRGAAFSVSLRLAAPTT